MIEPNESKKTTPLLGWALRHSVPQWRSAAPLYHGTIVSACERGNLNAGQVSRPVWLQTVEEIWYVLEGRGRVWRCPPEADPAAVTAAPVGPGDALTIPTRWRFQFSADKDAPLRFLCYTSPPWPGPEEAQPAEQGGLGEATV